MLVCYISFDIRFCFVYNVIMETKERRPGFILRGQVHDTPDTGWHDRCSACLFVEGRELPIAVVAFTRMNFSNLEAVANAFYTLASDNDLSGVKNTELRAALEEYRSQTTEGVHWSEKNWRFLNANLAEIKEADDKFPLKGSRTSTFILTTDKSDL